MKRPRPDFKKRSDQQESYYDPEFDDALIEASFAKQYGIRLRQEPDITYAEWLRLLSGLMDDTPLGKIIQIRSERDSKVIKKFGDYERRVRREWDTFKAKNKSPDQAKADIKQFQQLMKTLFGKK